MEKLINQVPYNTSDLTSIASWQHESGEIQETLYFADNGSYLLHCLGSMAQMQNAYGTQSYANEDLIVLSEEDVCGWLIVHAPAVHAEIFEDLAGVA